MKKISLLIFSLSVLSGIFSGKCYAQSLGRLGAADITKTCSGGTVCMGGGTDVDAAFQWMIQRSGGGDFVVLRSTGTNAYNSYIYGMSPAPNSVETFLIGSAAMGNDSTITQAVRKAEAIFFTGGNQDNYNTWIKGTAVGKAVLDAVKIRHVPVGGTSAGDAIMGWVYYSAHTSSLAGSDGLADPYVSNSDIMYNDFLKNAFLQNTICEPHFLTRGRQGRLMSFMARMNKDQGISPVKALASDESSAICIDSNGIGMAVGTGRVHFIRQWCAAPETCVSGSPLLWKNGVEVYSIIAGDNTTLPSAGMAFNLKTWTVTGGSFTHEWWTISPAGTINIGQTTATPAICNPTGLSEVNVSEAEFSAYQSGRSIVLKAANLTSGNDCIIDLYDITGKQIANLKIAPGETSFETSMDVNGLPSGIYLIIIRNSDLRKVIKVSIR